jgi:hypothetical protein
VESVKPKIKTTLAIMKEIVTAIMTAICGHPMDPPLSKEARRVYRAWSKRKFSRDSIELIKK